MASDRVLICGVSARAAAESAARAGYAVESLDAFGDLDQHPAVRARSTTRDFGRAFTAATVSRVARDVACDAVACLSPFENHPRAVAALARGRALWGNPPDVLRRVRHPAVLADALRARGLPHLAVRMDDGRGPLDGAWMVKPVRSGGGHRIRPWRQGEPLHGGTYLQEHVTGTPGSFVFVASGGGVTPVALTRQLIGEEAFGARGYRYCGNIVGAPADLEGRRGTALAGTVTAIAGAMAEGFGLRGLNGIDFVVRDGVPFTVEVNPRWTGAMEAVERWTGAPLFAAHAAAFGAGEAPPLAAWPSAPGVMGKAIVFARTDVVMGDTRPWLAEDDVRDVPHPGERIAAGHPVCTVFAGGSDPAECHAALVRRARLVYDDLERRRAW